MTSITILMIKIDHVYTFVGICIDYMRTAFFDTTPNIAVRKGFLFDLTNDLEVVHLKYHCLLNYNLKVLTFLTLDKGAWP